MNWWERFWYSITHPFDPVPSIDNDSGWDSMPNGNDPTSMGNSGSFFNDLTGVTTQNAYNSAEAAKQRAFEQSERLAVQDYNSAEAAKARDFNMMMDSTRYQRTMADLQSAGVNPMALFMNGGAGVGGSGSISAASSSVGSGSSASNGGNSASAVGGIIRALTSLLKVAK